VVEEAIGSVSVKTDREARTLQRDVEVEEGDPTQVDLTAQIEEIEKDTPKVEREVTLIEVDRKTQGEALTVEKESTLKTLETVKM